MPKQASAVRDFDAGCLLGSLAISLGFWIIIGALAYSDWPKSVPADANAVFSGFLSVFCFISLLIACGQFTHHPSLSPAAIFSAGVLGSSIATAYCILTSGWRNHYHYAFWITGGSFVGWALEISTRLLTTLIQRLAGSGTGDSLGNTRAAYQDDQKKVE